MVGSRDIRRQVPVTKAGDGRDGRRAMLGEDNVGNGSERTWGELHGKVADEVARRNCSFLAWFEAR